MGCYLYREDVDKNSLAEDYKNNFGVIIWYLYYINTYKDGILFYVDIFLTRGMGKGVRNMITLAVHHPDSLPSHFSVTVFIFQNTVLLQIV